MSDTAITYSGGSAFATSRRGGIDDYELDFIRRRRGQNVSVQNIARMLGRHQADVSMVMDAVCVPKTVPTPVPVVVKAPALTKDMDAITKRHAAAWGLSLDDMRGFSRSRAISYPRCAAILEMRRSGIYSREDIASYFRRTVEVIDYIVSHGRKREEAGKLNPFKRKVAKSPTIHAPSMGSIIQATAALYGITEDELRNPKHPRRDAPPLHHAMWALRQVEGTPGRPYYSFKVIGFEFGRDHTTVMNAVQVHEKRRWAAGKAVAA